MSGFLVWVHPMVLPAFFSASGAHLGPLLGISAAFALPSLHLSGCAFFRSLYLGCARAPASALNTFLFSEQFFLSFMNCSGDRLSRQRWAVSFFGWRG